MASVSHRIGVLIDLFMGAAYVDRDCVGSERDYVRALVADLLCTPRLPAEIEAKIDQFCPESFDLRASAAEFLREPPMNKRRLMELVAYVTLSDGAQGLEEDSFLRQLGEALGMRAEEYRHLTSDPDMAALRESFVDIARIPVRVA